MSEKEKEVGKELTTQERSLKLALAAAETAAENRGREILVLDMQGQTCLFDYFVIITGTSRKQLHAISEEIDHVLEDDLGDKRLGIEGYRESRWILLDYGSIIIHIFEEDLREFYQLENLWATASHVDLTGVVPEGQRYGAQQKSSQ
ncbi:MAG: ribosome silencing factor [Pirellulaceae bacterium]|nr:ribosome silencing factor [Pirellulaceae bacterium]